jgi:nucleoside-diphosphate-sugar epimerase
MRFARRITREILIRALADAIMVNAAFLLALAIRLLWAIWLDPSLAAREILSRYLQIYSVSSWLLTLTALIVFWASGFYTHGRVYRGRYKAVIIFQAVSLVYLIYGFVVFLSRDLLSPLPRAAIFLAWAITLAFVAGSRLWAKAWRRVVVVEDYLFRRVEPPSKVQSVLVIGGAGYIGSILCRQLLEKGYHVRVLDALLYGDAAIRELYDRDRFDFVEGDSRNVENVVRAMRDMDAVVHLGEIVGDPATALDEKLTLEINLAATRLVAEAAKGYGARRFVYASSCSVYGAGSEVLSEQSILNPVSLYARTKVGAEKALLALNGPDFHPVLLRLGTVYGLSPRLRFDLVINLLTAKAVCDGQITIFGGEQWRPFVHVADVARAIVRCVEAPAANVRGQVFNVGSDQQNYTIARVGELIQRLIPEARLVQMGDDADRRDYHVSFAKIHRELGFEPRCTVEEGVREIEAALRDGRVANYRDKCYSNYKTLSDSDNHLSIRARHISALYASAPRDEATEAAAPALGGGTEAR